MPSVRLGCMDKGIEERTRVYVYFISLAKYYIFYLITPLYVATPPADARFWTSTVAIAQVEDGFGPS
jgi:hypothetical protein